jgi:hypothetical protein
MNTIIAVMMVLLPGMDTPVVQQKPVASYQECVVEIGKMLDVLKEHVGEEKKVLAGCQITEAKSDPS